MGKSDLKTIIPIIALTLITAPAWADWSVKGEGNYSCPDYVAARKINSKQFYNSISWVQGFVTGVNYERNRANGDDSFIARDFPPVSMVDWLEDYCRDNPQDYLSDAAQSMVEELQGK